MPSKSLIVGIETCLCNVTLQHIQRELHFGIRFLSKLVFSFHFKQLLAIIITFDVGRTPNAFFNPFMPTSDVKLISNTVYQKCNALRQIHKTLQEKHVSSIYDNI